MPRSATGNQVVHHVVRHVQLTSDLGNGHLARGEARAELADMNNCRASAGTVAVNP